MTSTFPVTSTGLRLDLQIAPVSDAERNESRLAALVAYRVRRMLADLALELCLSEGGYGGTTIQWRNK
jgi:hypothetical protein